jgi:transcriptional regulator with XRE-family HTH domain
MIAAERIADVRRLLATGGLSQREIARRTGVSRGTVGAVAAGKRTDRTEPRHAGHPELKVPAGPPRRCGGCGGMVAMPCLLCRARVARAAARREQRTTASPELNAPLQLNLREEHRVRYEAIRRRGGMFSQREALSEHAAHSAWLPRLRRVKPCHPAREAMPPSA